MAVGVLFGGPARRPAHALAAVRDTPAPVGGQARRVALLARAVSELQGVSLRELAGTLELTDGTRIGPRGSVRGRPPPPDVF